MVDGERSQSWVGWQLWEVGEVVLVERSGYEDGLELLLRDADVRSLRATVEEGVVVVEREEVEHLDFLVTTRTD